MTIGPGRVERAIARTIYDAPSLTFSVEELVAIAYPGINRVEKKHRVVVRRAAKKVGDRARWAWTRPARPGHPIIYYNLLDHRSYGIAQIRGSYRQLGATHAEVSAVIDDPTPINAVIEQWKAAIRPGGRFWLEVEYNRAGRAHTLLAPPALHGKEERPSSEGPTPSPDTLGALSRWDQAGNPRS